MIMMIILMVVIMITMTGITIIDNNDYYNNFNDIKQCNNIRT
jgi:hypothetical protein